MATKFKSLLGVVRGPFLVLAPACSLVGLGTAYWTTGGVDLRWFLLAAAGAVAAHIAVNVFNEYCDFKTGLDTRTRRTPFSGGSGTLQTHPELAPAALALAVAAMLTTGAIGIVFVLVRGWGLLPLGLIGMFLLYAYTAWLVYHPLLCLLAPGLGFGPLTVMGTHFALTGEYSWTAAVASLVPLFLVSNLLLLNQFPDVEADRAAGRRHYPILIGRWQSARLYAVFMLATYAVIVVGILDGLLPPFSALALLTAVIALAAVRGALRNADNLPRLQPALGMNVLVSLLTPVLFAVGSFLP